MWKALEQLRLALDAEGHNGLVMTDKGLADLRAELAGRAPTAQSFNFPIPSHAEIAKASARMAEARRGDLAFYCSGHVEFVPSHTQARQAQMASKPKTRMTAEDAPWPAKPAEPAFKPRDGGGYTSQFVVLGTVPGSYHAKWATAREEYATTGSAAAFNRMLRYVTEAVPPSKPLTVPVAASTRAPRAPVDARHVLAMSVLCAVRGVVAVGIVGAMALILLWFFSLCITLVGG